MGRPVKNAQLKVLEGNFRPDRDSHGPSVPVGLPKCPAWLPRNAKKHWREIGGMLVEHGLITLADGPGFVLFCDSYGKFEEVCRRMKTLDDTLDTTPQNYEVQSALFTVRNKLWDQVRSMSQDFGFTPGGRSKIKAPAQQQLPFGGTGWGDV